MYVSYVYPNTQILFYRVQLDPVRFVWILWGWTCIALCRWALSVFEGIIVFSVQHRKLAGWLHVGCNNWIITLILHELRSGYWLQAYLFKTLAISSLNKYAGRKCTNIRNDNRIESVSVAREQAICATVTFILLLFGTLIIMLEQSTTQM